jgi:hypothetical protein
MQNEKEKEKDTDALGAAWGIVCVWAVSITTIIRRRSGRNYLGVRFPMAIALIGIYACATHEQLMFWMISVFVLSAFFQRNQEISARKRGQVIHSYYSGTPVVVGILTKNEQIAKAVIEPAMAMAFGMWAAAYWNEAVGKYFIIGSVMMFMVEAMGRIQARHEEDSMSDAMIEGQYRASVFRRR